MSPVAPPKATALGAVLVLALGCAAPPEPPRAAEPEPSVFRGMLVHGHEVRELRPCDGGPAMWVVGDAALWEVHHSLAVAGERDAEVYVEVAGIAGPPPRDGFGAGHARQLTITGLRFAHPAGEGPRCSQNIDWIWRASGNEPFWSVTVSGGGVTFSTPEDPAGPALGEPRFETPDVVTAGSGETALRLTLVAEPCRDSMSGAWHAWSARVAVGERRLEGCARRGAAVAG